MRTQFKQKAPRLEAHVVSHWFKQQCVVQQELFSGNPKAAQLITHCTIGPTACCLYCMTTMSYFAIKANKVQVRDHYVQAAAENRKLQFLGRKQEQLPYPLWDPDVWTDAYRLGPAKSHKLVYLATDQQKQHYVVKCLSDMVWMRMRHGQKLNLHPNCYNIVKLLACGSRLSWSIYLLSCLMRLVG